MTLTEKIEKIDYIRSKIFGRCIGQLEMYADGHEPSLKRTKAILRAYNRLRILRSKI